MNHLWLEILLFIPSVIAVLIGVLGLPGNFVPVIAALIAVLAGNGESFTWPWFFIFLAIAVSGEVVDQITGLLGAKKYGASKAGMVGAVIGGFVGAILGTLVLPVVGSLIGVFVGCFTLTFIFELIFSSKSAADSQRAGIGALLGKAAATAYKLIAGFVLLILMIWRFWII